MSETTSGQTPPSPAPAPAPVPVAPVTAAERTVPPEMQPMRDGKVTLEQFCTTLSKSDKRVAMIGAFHTEEKLAKHWKDTPAGFKARYQAFCTRPVA